MRACMEYKREEERVERSERGGKRGMRATSAWHRRLHLTAPEISNIAAFSGSACLFLPKLCLQQTKRGLEGLSKRKL